MIFWEVFVVKYVECNVCMCKDSFLFDDNYDYLYDMDYFIWVLCCGFEFILVDIGYDYEEGQWCDWLV